MHEAEAECFLSSLRAIHGAVCFSSISISVFCVFFPHKMAYHTRSKELRVIHGGDFNQ